MSPFNPTPEPAGDTGHYFTIAELRAADTSYADEVRYPNEKLEAARDWVETHFEHEKSCAVAFVPRAATERLRGKGEVALRLKWPALRSVTSVTIDGVALTEAELDALALDDREVRRHGGWPRGALIQIAYTHGYDAPDAEVKKAALMLAKEFLVDSGLASRATVESTDVGFYRLSIAAPGGRTGIPYVDAVIEDRNRRLPV